MEEELLSENLHLQTTLGKSEQLSVKIMTSFHEGSETGRKLENILTKHCVYPELSRPWHGNEIFAADKWGNDVTP